jgi:hypothetical protein
MLRLYATIGCTFEDNSCDFLGSAESADPCDFVEWVPTGVCECYIHVGAEQIDGPMRGYLGQRLLDAHLGRAHDSNRLTYVFHVNHEKTHTKIN